MTVRKSSERFSETIRRLSSAQKPPAKGSPAYSRFVNRRLGRYLAAASYHAGLTPNQVSFISAVFSTAGIVLIGTVRPSPLSAVAAAAALLTGYAFDSADGQLARLRGGGTPGGEWLDHVVDSVKNSAVHLAVLVCWYRYYELPEAGLLVPAAFTLVSAVFFFAQILTDQLRRAHPGQAPHPADSSRSSVLRSLVVAPTDYGLLCLGFGALAASQVFVVLYSLLLMGMTLFIFAALPKWYREVAAFQPNPASGARALLPGPGTERARNRHRDVTMSMLRHPATEIAP